MIFGHYFQLKHDDFQRLLSDQSQQDFILQCSDFEDLYESYYFIGDLWQAIDFLLTGEKLPESDHPLHQLIYGGKELSTYEPIQTIGPFRYFGPDEVLAMVKRLEPITPDHLMKSYSPETMTENEIHPHDWDEADSDEMKSIIEECYGGLREFFNEASSNGDYVVRFITS